MVVVHVLGFVDFGIERLAVGNSRLLAKVIAMT
jgi:hypothetical protein